MSTTQTTEKAEAHTAEQSAKHTPRPWPVTWSITPVGESLAQITCSVTTVAAVSPIITERFTNAIAEMNANFRLIASAPELLEALKTARSVLGTLLQSDSGTYINATRQINAAISKAEKGAQ